jgi:hypothetical protein
LRVRMDGCDWRARDFEGRYITKLHSRLSVSDDTPASASHFSQLLQDAARGDYSSF